MPAYEYIALNAKGRQTKGLQEGDTARQVRQMPVSYTHLTLPTIYSV